MGRILRGEHIIQLPGRIHAAECACHWSASGSGVVLDHRVLRHLGKRLPPCDLECCQTLTGAVAA